VLDACVLIAHLDGDDAHHERATALLLEAVDDPLFASGFDDCGCARRAGPRGRARPSDGCSSAARNSQELWIGPTR